MFLRAPGSHTDPCPSPGLTASRDLQGPAVWGKMPHFWSLPASASAHHPLFSSKAPRAVPEEHKLITDFKTSKLITDFTDFKGPQRCLFVILFPKDTKGKPLLLLSQCRGYRLESCLSRQGAREPAFRGWSGETTPTAPAPGIASWGRTWPTEGRRGPKAQCPTGSLAEGDTQARR